MFTQASCAWNLRLIVTSWCGCVKDRVNLLHVTRCVGAGVRLSGGAGSGLVEDDDWGWGLGGWWRRVFMLGG
jgi:hypothetical protein